MARFDVYANPDPGDRAVIPYFLDVQSNFLDALDTRVVVPLQLASRFALPTRNLNPQLSVADKSVIMNTAAIGALPIGELRRPVANLASEQLVIQDALDTLFGAY